VTIRARLDRLERTAGASLTRVTDEEAEELIRRYQRAHGEDATQPLSQEALTEGRAAVSLVTKHIHRTEGGTHP
jgi:hypothetical protein